MPMLNADERSPLDAAIKAVGELSIERYFAGSPPAVSIPPERESALPAVPGSARHGTRPDSGRYRESAAGNLGSALTLPRLWRSLIPLGTSGARLG